MNRVAARCEAPEPVRTVADLHLIARSSPISEPAREGVAARIASGGPTLTVETAPVAPIEPAPEIGVIAPGEVMSATAAIKAVSATAAIEVMPKPMSSVEVMPETVPVVKVVIEVVVEVPVKEQTIVESDERPHANIEHSNARSVEREVTARIVVLDNVVVDRIRHRRVGLIEHPVVGVKRYASRRVRVGNPLAILVPRV